MGCPVSTTIIASLLVGAVLALRFKVFILVPTILAAWAVLTGIGLAWEITAAWIALEIAVVTTALQVGYSQSPAAGGVPCCWRGSRFLLAELFPFMFLRTLPVGFMASLLTAALLLSMSDLAIAQRSGVRSGVIGSAPTDSARSGVIGGGYRGARSVGASEGLGSIRTSSSASRLTAGASGS